MWFIGVEVEQETSAPPPKKNPGSALDSSNILKVEIMHHGDYNSMFMFYKHFRSKRTAFHGFKFCIFT